MIIDHHKYSLLYVPYLLHVTSARKQPFPIKTQLGSVKEKNMKSLMQIFATLKYWLQKRSCLTYKVLLNIVTTAIPCLPIFPCIDSDCLVKCYTCKGIMLTKLLCDLHKVSHLKTWRFHFYSWHRIIRETSILFSTIFHDASKILIL